MSAAGDGRFPHVTIGSTEGDGRSGGRDAVARRSAPPGPVAVGGEFREVAEAGIVGGGKKGGRLRQREQQAEGGQRESKQANLGHGWVLAGGSWSAGAPQYDSQGRACPHVFT